MFLGSPRLRVSTSNTTSVRFAHPTCVTDRQETYAGIIDRKGLQTTGDKNTIMILLPCHGLSPSLHCEFSSRCGSLRCLPSPCGAFIHTSHITCTHRRWQSTRPEVNSLGLVRVGIRIRTRVSLADGKTLPEAICFTTGPF